MSFAEIVRESFDHLGNRLIESLNPDENLTLNLVAENQHYLRFNGARVRQSTRVWQQRLTLLFQASGRQVTHVLDVSGQTELDLEVALSLIDRARQETRILPEDPYACLSETAQESDHHHAGSLPALEDLVSVVSAEGAACDLTGLYAGGAQVRATRNSRGVRHVFSLDGFFIDYSLYTRNASGGNKAVKDQYAGHHWHTSDFRQRLSRSRDCLGMLAHDDITLEPGCYRTYLAPAAVNDILGMFSWGAVSRAAWMKGDSALGGLIEGRHTLSPMFSLSENFDLGLAPRFNSLGEMAPARVPVIAQGALVNLMTSSRSAREFGVQSNAAEQSEGLRSPDMASGTLSSNDILSCLGTGLFITNLHYLNWSDIHNARITGMTRYACFWVEDGQLVAPISDLRFDDSLYRMLGTQLEAVTDTTETILRTDTYHQRSLGGSRLPGILLKELRYTL